MTQFRVEIPYLDFDVVTNDYRPKKALQKELDKLGYTASIIKVNNSNIWSLKTFAKGTSCKNNKVNFYILDCFERNTNVN